MQNLDIIVLIVYWQIVNYDKRKDGTMRFYIEYFYDNRWAQSPQFEGDTLSEIYEQAKHIHKTMDNCPVFVCIYVSSLVVTKIPL